MAGPPPKSSSGLRVKGQKRKLSEATPPPTRSVKKRKSGADSTKKVKAGSSEKVASGIKDTITEKYLEQEVLASGTAATEEVGDETVEVEEHPNPVSNVEPGSTHQTTNVPTSSSTTTTKPLPPVSVLPLFTSHKYHRLAPPKPSSSTLPLPQASYTSRPRGASSTGPTGQVKRRDVIYITKNTSLGSYMRRCKKLLVEEGHSQITLHALSAAIPHALLVLHALLDILPFPKKHVSHELKSSSVKCFDEKKGTGGKIVSSKTKLGEGSKNNMVPESGDEEANDWEPVLFDDEEPEGAVRVRVKSALEIIIKVGPARSRPTAQEQQKQKQKEVEILDKVREEPAPKKVGLVSTQKSTTIATVGDAGTEPTLVDRPGPAVAGSSTILPSKKKNRPSKAKRMAMRQKYVAGTEDKGTDDTGNSEVETGTRGDDGEAGDEEEMMNMM